MKAAWNRNFKNFCSKWRFTVSRKFYMFSVPIIVDEKQSLSEIML